MILPEYLSTCFHLPKSIIPSLKTWPKTFSIITACNPYSSGDRSNDDKNYKFIQNEQVKRKEILLIINLVAIVIQNGMKILGVSLPKKM